MAMNRRDFLKSAALTVAAGMVMGPTALAKEKTESVAEDGKDILNYNPKMKYWPMGQTGVKVSALGFGMLRLPMLADGKTIDMNQTVDMVHRAIDGGVNYIDTGRVYLGGQSELAVGKALANGWRDRYTSRRSRRGGSWRRLTISKGCLTNRGGLSARTSSTFTIST